MEDAEEVAVRAVDDHHVRLLGDEPVLHERPPDRVERLPRCRRQDQESFVVELLELGHNILERRRFVARSLGADPRVVGFEVRPVLVRVGQDGRRLLDDAYADASFGKVRLEELKVPVVVLAEDEDGVDVVAPNEEGLVRRDGSRYTA